MWDEATVLATDAEDAPPTADKILLSEAVKIRLFVKRLNVVCAIDQKMLGLVVVSLALMLTSEQMARAAGLKRAWTRALTWTKAPS